MELTEEQKAAVTAWVAEGCGLSEIQRRIASEFKLRPTFMDVRFLILDLGLEIKDATASAKKTKDAEDETQAVTDDADDDVTPEEALDGVGGVTVEVDRLIKPGALISGTVVFSDGMKATWMLDQAGRLALDPAQPGYRPGPEDIEGFQRALQEEMMKKGY